jgi:hypothetical protein
MKRNPLTISLLSLSLIFAVLILSESAPAKLFESKTIREVEPEKLVDIKGNAECSCGEEDCTSEAASEKCVWYIGTGCSGCNGEDRLYESYGTKDICLKNGEPDSPLGCCENECSDSGCTDAICPHDFFVKTTEDCYSSHYQTACEKKACYSRQ